MEALQDAIGTGSIDQAEMLGRLIRRVADLEAAVAQSTRQRRELHNQLVELRGNVRLPTRFLTSHLFHSYLRIPTSDLQACNQQGNSKGPPEQ